MEFIIRQIKQDDNLALAALIRAVFEEFDAPRNGTVYSDPTTNNLYQLFKAERSALWVATVNDIIVGCCGVYPTEGLDEDCAEMVKFYLSSAARGQGIGRALMEKAIDSAKELRYKDLYLESFSAFKKAVGIYEKQGFKELANPMGNSGHTSCNIWMVKEL